MSDRIRFDDHRSAAWRDAIVEAARADRARGGGAHKRVALIVGLVIAALLVSGGGVAYALSTHLLTPAAAPTNSPTPIESETPSATSTPSASPTEDPVAIARGYAERACETLQSALDSNGNIANNDEWAAALVSAQDFAATAAELDPARAGLASNLTVLAQTSVPDTSATDAEKNGYFDAYLPVATDCWSVDVHLATD
jgi:hypothetical protein